jgi:hypothetical protein
MRQPVDNVRIELLKAALQACAKEYDDRMKIFADLDAKAQSTLLSPAFSWPPPWHFSRATL